MTYRAKSTRRRELTAGYAHRNAIRPRVPGDDGWVFHYPRWIADPHAGPHYTVCSEFIEAIRREISQ